MNLNTSLPKRLNIAEQITLFFQVEFIHQEIALFGKLCEIVWQCTVSVFMNFRPKIIFYTNELYDTYPVSS